MKVAMQRGGLVGLVLSVAFPAFGDLPKVLDRVPVNAGVVVTVSSLSQFHERVTDLAALLKLDRTEAGQGLKMASMLLQTPGLDAAGSIALAIMPGPDGAMDFDGDEPPMALIVPLKDFGAFVETFDGTVEQRIATLDMMGEAVFLRDVGGGWGVLGPDRDLVAGFNAEGGNLAAHRARFGAVGERVLDDSHVTISADVKMLEPVLRQAVQGFNDQMEMAAMMMGEQGAGMEGMAAMFEKSVDDLLRDGQTALIGLGLGETGVTFDLAAQFKAGSETAKSLESKGRALELLGRVPNEPFLFAMSMDTSSPAMKKWMVDLTEMSASMDPKNSQMFGFMDLTKMVKDQNATVFLMGNPPTIMGGALFSKTVQYTECGNPGKMLDVVKDAVLAMDGQTTGPMSFKTTYNAGAIEVDGVKADAWGMSMRIDPADPEARQMGPMLAMVFGAPMGPSGYYAPTSKGVVTTFNKNAAFLSDAIKAANQGNGLSNNKAISAAAEYLPSDSSVLFFVGLKELHQHVATFAMLAGVDLGEAPEDLGAIAAGAAMTDGGFQARLYVPNRLIDFAASLAEKFKPEGGMAPQGDRPRF